MKKIFMSILVLIMAAVVSKDADAKCEAAFKRFKKAEAALPAAKAEYDDASNEYNQADANLNQAVQNLNAIAANLGASGRATGESATFGRSPTNPAFFDNADYKAAKQAWQDAKAVQQAAKGRLNQAGANLNKAQGEYDAAKAEYEKLRAQHIGDEGLLRVPEPLKLDETLTEKVEKLIQPRRWKKMIKEGDVTYDISFVQKPAGDKTLLDVAILPKGKDAQHKKLLPEKLKLFGGETVIDPLEADYYAAKEPGAEKVVPHIVTGVGGLSTGGTKQTYPKGKACHPTQQGSKGQTLGGALGRSAVSAGLGLLASQAASQAKAPAEIMGLKGTFDITGYEDKLKDMNLQISVLDEADGNEVDIIVPALGKEK